jgi:hypothetical protein
MHKFRMRLVRLLRNLSISARHDWPAFRMSGANMDGMDGSKTEPWMQTHAGDMFVATIPRQLLEHNNPEDTPLMMFARAL